jgi:general stress protein YciG
MPRNQEQGNRGNNQGGKGNSNRGFASMDPEKQREIASEGGKASHEQGTGHEFDSEEAREAGRKGGQASGGNRGGNQGGNQGGGNR